MAPAATRRAFPPPVLTVAAALAAAAWAAWLAALAQGGCWGAAPHAGCPRLDFSAFWGAGRLALAGRAGDAYAWPSLRAELEQAFHLTGVRPLPFMYPPPMLLAAAGLGALPYSAAFALWTAAGLGAYAAAAWAVLRRPQAWLVACAPAGAFFCAFAGQTGFLTAAALAGGLLCLERRPLAAGVLFALFACKPQLAALAPVALVAGGRWRALAAAGVASVALWSAAVAVFGPGVLVAFLHGARDGGGLFAGSGWLPWWKVQSAYGALRAAGAPATLAAGVQAAVALAAGVAVWTAWRSRAAQALKAATLAAAALTVSPYGFVYDGPLLAVAALFLLREARAGEALSPAEGALLALGLWGQAVFVVAPGPLVTPAAAWVLLAAARLRATRRSASETSTAYPADPALVSASS